MLPSARPPDMDAAVMETPAKGVEVSAVDITAIEQHKENIQPLTSGRSASQLASLSSHTRSGLGAKLAHEHKLFQARLDAIDVYEQTGQYSQQQQDATANQNAAQASSGVPQLTLEDVQHMADDPLDVHHQYARFVVGNYPAGASATRSCIRRGAARSPRARSQPSSKSAPNGTGWHESDINRWIADPVSWRLKRGFDDI